MGPCILTDWRLNPSGYGMRGNTYAHRHAYAQAHGEIPEGLVVRHKCDVRNCINPDHLELGTQLDNIRDMHERGRAVNPPVLRGEANHKAKLTATEAKEIYDSTERNTRLAERYGVSAVMVGLIKRGKAWQHVTKAQGMRV